MALTATIDAPRAGLPSEQMNVEIVVYQGEDGHIVAECPALPGCASQGTTREEALRNIREAIAGWLEVEAERGPGGRRRDIEIVDVAV